MSATRAALPAGREQEMLVLAVKLLVHVAAPALLLAALGAKIAPLFNSGLGAPGFWPPLLVLGVVILGLLCVVSPRSAKLKRYTPPRRHSYGRRRRRFYGSRLKRDCARNFCFGQSCRLASQRCSKPKPAPWLPVLCCSRWHMYRDCILRGHPGVDGYSSDPVQVIAFTIGVLSPVALLFGTLWARTRSLLLIVLLHAAVDVLPNMPEFVNKWVR